MFYSKQQQQQQAKISRAMDSPCYFLQNSKAEWWTCITRSRNLVSLSMPKIHNTCVYIWLIVHERKLTYHLMVSYIQLGRLHHLGTSSVWTSPSNLDRIGAMYWLEWLVNFWKGLYCSINLQKGILPLASMWRLALLTSTELVHLSVVVYKCSQQ